ncbi:cement precursor protein 3B variant 1 [Schistosoma japonicum]|nr:cement precursor protein 3B variant 1 [Schistosoma japonicum]
MTFVDANVCDNGSENLIELANNALSLINIEPYIYSVQEITPNFVFDLAVVLFGSDILPYPDCIGPDYVENFESILRKLSQEIGEDLDHITAEELIAGEPRALSDFLVILTAFIAYCHETSRLQLIPTSDSCSPVCSSNLPVDSKLSSENKEFMEFQLSTSPELPRHSVNCAPMFSTSFHQSDRFVEQSTPMKRTPASLQTRNPYPSGDNVNSLMQKSNLPAIHSDYVKLSYPVTSCLPSFLEVHTDASPPATPNAMNAYLEIAHSSSSDAIVAHSLENSANMQQFAPSSLVDGSRKLKNSGSPSVHLSNKELFNGVNSVVSVDPSPLNGQSSVSSSRIKPSTHEHKVRLSTPSPNINNMSASSSTELIHKSVSDKHESSSSGRGRSLTVTQTIPCHSNTSAPSSLLELHTFPDSRSATHDIANYSIEYSNSCISRKSLKNQISNKKISNSCDSVGTSSILAWDEDNFKDNAKMDENKVHDGSLDELTSLLSASLSSDATDKTSSKVPVNVPTTDILSETNNFACALEKRLNYLRSVYIRAHSEAEALADLVQLITSSSQNIIEPMNTSQVNDYNKSVLKNDSFNNVCGKHSHLESLLVKTIDRIDQLLEKCITPLSKIIPSASNSCLDSARCLHPKSKAIPTNKRCSYSKYSELSKLNSSVCEDNFSDLELKKLMELKHEYVQCHVYIPPWLYL